MRRTRPQTNPDTITHFDVHLTAANQPIHYCEHLRLFGSCTSVTGTASPRSRQRARGKTHQANNGGQQDACCGTRDTASGLRMAGHWTAREENGASAINAHAQGLLLWRRGGKRSIVDTIDYQSSWCCPRREIAVPTNGVS